MKKKLGKHIFRLLDPIFHRRIHVLLNVGSSEFKKWNKKTYGIEDGYDEDSFAGFSVRMDKKGQPEEYVILVKRFDWTIQDQGTLIHEIVHTVIKIWDSNNIPHDSHTQEFLAHSIGNIYEDACRQIFKKKRKYIRHSKKV
jgi:hypothetical protein